MQKNKINRSMEIIHFLSFHLIFNVRAGVECEAMLAIFINVSCVKQFIVLLDVVN